MDGKVAVSSAPVFGDLVGQERVVAQLEQAAAVAARLLRGENALGMTHAWLFTGPPGSGRSVAARAFAAALLCPDQGCGQCPSCHQVRAGTHPDLMLVKPDGLSYGVKQTRNLVLRAAGAPSSGRWQVVVFEDADRATEQAANSGEEQVDAGRQMPAETDVCGYDRAQDRLALSTVATTPVEVANTLAVLTAFTLPTSEFPAMTSMETCAPWEYPSRTSFWFGQLFTAVVSSCSALVTPWLSLLA